MAKLKFSTKENSYSVIRLVEKGELHKIRRGIYIDTNDENEIAKTLNNSWTKIACNIFSNPVAVARTAAELMPANGWLYFVSGQIEKQRKVEIGHLVFVVSPGNSDRGIQQFTPDLKISNTARCCLENLAPSRGDESLKKTLGSAWVESKLVMEIQKGGEQYLNSLRDEARELAPILGLEREFEELNKLIGAILNTHPAKGVLQTRPGIANAKGESYDKNGVDRFVGLSQYLKSTRLTENPYTYNKAGWRNLTFFESYFSNFIEGTEFTIEEAEEIVFEKNMPYERHADSHDILAHIEISGDMSEMNKVPTNAVELIEILKVRHGILLAARPGKRPGEFKLKPNKAGTTEFVSPNLVEGTLVQGFDTYLTLSTGIQRAIYIHFMISEIHPFDDGNGRIARLMMNSELVNADQHKLVIPIVHKESYLNGLNAATRQGRFRTMIKVLHQMQCYSASLEWEEYDDVKTTLQHDAADKEPDEGITIFNKVIAKLGDDYPAG